jgi:hypothetical protein
MASCSGETGQRLPRSRAAAGQRQIAIAEKRANKVASAAAELVERRGGAKENAELQSTVRTQSRAAVS